MSDAYATLVEAGARAQFAHLWPRSEWDFQHDSIQNEYRGQVRAVLAALLGDQDSDLLVAAGYEPQGFRAVGDRFVFVHIGRVTRRDGSFYLASQPQKPGDVPSLFARVEKNGDTDG